MADVDVRRQSTEQQRNPSGQSLERSGQGSGLQRRGAYPSDYSSGYLSPFALNTADFFNTSPFSLMRRFMEEIDRGFEGYGGRRGGGELRHWSPTVEVTERDGKLEVVADLPGIKEDDVKVEVTDEGLVIRGERKQEHEERREGYHRSERSYGQFYRLIPLPENADLEQARAEFRNGELRISLPVPERHRKAREIPIHTSTAERKEPLSQTAGAQQSRKAVG
jgi:HSP20 family protein